MIIGYGSRTVEFVQELAAGDETIAGVLEHLIPVANGRWGRGRHSEYDPSGRSAVQRLAAYTANVVVIRLAIADGPVPLSRLCPAGIDTYKQWRAQVRFWEAMLSGSPQWGRFVDFIEVNENEPEAIPNWIGHSGYHEDMVAILEGDQDKAARLAVGRVLVWGPIPENLVDQPVPAAAQMLANLLSRRFATAADLASLNRIDDIPPELFALAAVAAANHAPDLSAEAVSFYLEKLRDNKRSDLMQQILTTLAVQRPHLVSVYDGRPDSLASDLMIELATLVSREASPVHSAGIGDLRDTTEGRALLAMPEDLARRLIPEMAASLISSIENPRQDGSEL